LSNFPLQGNVFEKRRRKWRESSSSERAACSRKVETEEEEEGNRVAALIRNLHLSMDETDETAP
jgi:hypothetical protein